MGINVFKKIDAINSIIPPASKTEIKQENNTTNPHMFIIDVIDSATDVIKAFDGIKCGFKPTSCPDQIAKALKTYLENNQ